MDSKINSYLDLQVWKVLRELPKDLYELTTEFPKQEMFGLISQMRRCAVSIPSNLAEGCGRNHVKDSLQFFYISRGSIYELETQLYISYDLGYLSKEKFNAIHSKLQHSRKLLTGFIKYFQTLTTKST